MFRAILAVANTCRDDHRIMFKVAARRARQSFYLVAVYVNDVKYELRFSHRCDLICADLFYNGVLDIDRLWELFEQGASTVPYID